MQQLMADIQLLTKPVGTVSVAHKPIKPLLPAPVYYLQAVLPGRAWLQSSLGQTQTVRVGDLLRGYGAVTAINAEKGVVQTSSGKRIEYGRDDS